MIRFSHYTDRTAASGTSIAAKILTALLFMALVAVLMVIVG